MSLTNSWAKTIASEPVIWLTTILLLGFIINPGALDAAGMESGNPSVLSSGKGLRILSVLITGALSFLVLLKNHKLGKVAYGNMGLLFLYCFLAILSMVFSPLKLMTFFKGIEIFVIILLSATIHTSLNRYESAKTYIHFLFSIYSLTAVGAYLQLLIYGPEASHQLEGTKLLSFQLEIKYPGMVGNATGYLGALVLLFGLYLTFLTGGRYSHRAAHNGLFIAALGFSIVFLSYTRSILVFVLLAAFVYYILNRKYIHIVMMTLVAIFILLLPGVSSEISVHMRRGDSDEALMTMSSRTIFWKDILNRKADILLTGNGFGTGTLFMGYETDIFGRGETFAARNAHNSVLEILNSIGLVGIAVWMLFLGNILRKLLWFQKAAKDYLHPDERQFHLFVLVVFFLSIMRSLVNSTFVYLDYFFPVITAFSLYADSLREKYHKLFDLRNGNNVREGKGVP